MPIDEAHAETVLLRKSPEKENDVTPDKVLAAIGARNPYILFIFTLLNLLWGFAVMPMMVSAFAIGGESADNATAESSSGRTIVEEFRLTGDRSYLADATGSALIFGTMIGSCIVPHLSDWYGRKPVLIYTMAHFGLMGVLCSIAPNVFAVLLFCFLQGIAITGLITISWALCYESTPANLRITATLFSGVTWTFGYVAIAPIAYFFRDWRWLYAITSAPSLIAAVIYYFAIPESFHFLVSKGRTRAVEEWVGNTEAWKRSACASDVDVALLMDHANRLRHANSENDQAKNKLLRKLFTNRTLLLYLVVMAYLWSVDSFTYYGISLLSTKLAGNAYVNYTLSGLVELPCYLSIPFMMQHLGRRKFIVLTHLLTSLSFLVTVFSEPESSLTLCAWLTGKFAITWSFTGSFAFASEIFPTVYRTGLMGICEVFSRFCTVFAPALRTVGDVVPALPMTLITVMAGIAALVALLLPETKDLELPDVAEEITENPKRLQTKSAAATERNIS